MTNNIDKLKQIAPLLSGTNFWASSSDNDNVHSTGEGLFHNLEIDDAYPDSEPRLSIRATNVRWKHYIWDHSTENHETEEEFCELVFEIEEIEYIEYSPRQPWDDGYMAEQYIIQFKGSPGPRVIFAWL